MAGKAKTVSKVVDSLEGLSKKLKLGKSGEELRSVLRGLGDEAGSLNNTKILNKRGLNPIHNDVNNITQKLGERGGYKNLNKSEKDFLTKLGYDDPIQKKAAAAASANNETSAVGKAAKEAVEEEEKKPWWHTEEAEANWKQRTAEKQAIAKTKLDNDIKDAQEEYNIIAGKHRDANGILDDKNADVIAARKKMDEKIAGFRKAHENDIKQIQSDGPGIMDWVQGNNIDSTVVGIGALGFAGAVAFGGAKSNADLYAAGSLTPGY